MTVISARPSLATGCSDSQIGHDHDAAAAARVAVGAGHAVRLGDAHAERAGVGGDERRADVGMSGQPVQLAQPWQQIKTQALGRDQQGVQRRSVVPLRREIDVGSVAVAVRIVQLLGPQPGDEVGGAEARSDVTGTSLHDHEERVDPAQVGDQCRSRCRIGHATAHGAKRLARHVRQCVITN
jgi:hypothetical protein